MPPSNQSNRSLMLFDSASLWYRAYYGMPDTLVSDSGKPINAIRGFLDMSARLIAKYQPGEIIFCLDGDWRPSWRVELFPGYKANRVDEDGTAETEPDLLTEQIPVILDVLEAIGFPVVGLDDYEADDVIASYCKQTKNPVRVVTGDRDLFQLVDDSRDQKIVYLAKGISNHDLVDEQYVSDRFEIPAKRYGLFASIRGDASDGLPGIKGIGEKGAAILAREFASMDEIIKSAKSDERIPLKLRSKILQDISYAMIAEQLTACRTDLTLPKISNTMTGRAVNEKKLNSIKNEYSLSTSVERVLSVLTSK